jgi:hypothetical protein
MASEVAGQRMEAATQNAGRREPSWPAAAREEKAAASGAESGDSLAKKKAGWRRLLCTLRFQYRMKAAVTTYAMKLCAAVPGKCKLKKDKAGNKRASKDGPSK